MSLVLPQSTIALLNLATIDHRHPGLQLDKFSVPGDQTAQRKALSDVCRIAGDPTLFSALIERRRRLLATVPSTTAFSCTSTGPLTLHLARASALENAGICLHPLYGFVYLPGSGLKGMARAYTTVVAGALEADVVAVFGNQPGEPKSDRQTAGQIVFHDAWPAAWPKLIVDIVNNHHPAYYQAKDDDNAHPPGDWEDPIPVYFLAVPHDTQFEFALAPRRGDADAGLVNLARDWLQGALTELGAGAKTAAGYGSFRLDVAESARIQGDALDPAARTLASPATSAPRTLASPATFTTMLELVTPAFLAGASQQADDCDLRPATLRGLLRWWWRTLHAGFVDVATLRKMEAMIWGDTQQGGAVRITVERKSLVGPFERPGKKMGKDRRGNDALENDDTFLKKNGVSVTTQGLFYAGYGTDEMVQAASGRKRKRRWCLGEGSQWRVRLNAKCAHFELRDAYGNVSRRIPVAAESICDQARAALWLFARFGGVGTKSRKGFGSFADLDDVNNLSLEQLKDAAKRFRDEWRRAGLPFRAGATATASLERVEFVEIGTPWTNPWFTLDQVGVVIQAYAQAAPTTQHGKHCGGKAVLGLPRQIHGPRDKPGAHQQHHQRPLKLRGPEGERHASPIHYHIGRAADGRLMIRAAVFFTGHLWDATVHPETRRAKPQAVASQEATDVLNALAAHLRVEFTCRAAELASHGTAPTWTPGSQASAVLSGVSTPSAASGSKLPSPGEWVDAELLNERTKKGGWKAKHLATGICGPLTNSGAAPGAAQPAMKLPLIVNSAKAEEISFRFPTAADQEKRVADGKQPHKPPPSPPPRRDGGRGRGGR
ncbi:MAG TPA: type III-B CRISPR module RAMP protein Cmr6 [Pirellulales bacterium]|nr:type III-B CRISPR module RAMP protein Cmr6 [Pirellulales bacterium]